MPTVRESATHLANIVEQVLDQPRVTPRDRETLASALQSLRSVLNASPGAGRAALVPWDTIARMRDAGESPREIAAKTGISTQAVYRRLKRGK